MRSERQIMDTILSVVKSSDNIRAAYMNGSRTNPNVDKDELRLRHSIFGKRCKKDDKRAQVAETVRRYSHYAGAGQRGYGMGRECRP